MIHCNRLMPDLGQLQMGRSPGFQNCAFSERSSEKRNIKQFHDGLPVVLLSTTGTNGDYKTLDHARLSAQ
jgi:hypothetical protein